MGRRSSWNLVKRDRSLESIAIDAKRRNWDAKRFSCLNARLGSSGVANQVFLILISSEGEGEDGLILCFLWWFACVS